MEADALWKAWETLRKGLCVSHPSPRERGGGEGPLWPVPCIDVPHEQGPKANIMRTSSMSQPGCHSSGRRLFRTALCSLLLPLALLSIACRSHESPAAAWLPAGAPAAPPSPSDIPPAVDRIIADTVQAKTVPAALRDQKERVQAWQEMGRFYAGRPFHPAWLTVHGPPR